MRRIAKMSKSWDSSFATLNKIIFARIIAEQQEKVTKASQLTRTETRFSFLITLFEPSFADSRLLQNIFFV